MVNNQAKITLLITLSLLSVGAFVTSALAPGLSTFDSVEDIDNINQYTSEGKITQELQDLLNKHGYQIVNPINEEEVESGEVVDIKIKKILPNHVKKIAVEDMYVTEEEVIEKGSIGYELFNLEVEVEGDIVSLKDKDLIERINPTNKVVGYGTLKTIEVDGKMREIKEVITVEATAYTKMHPCTGKNPDDPNYGITSTGIPVERGHIAVDPEVIPYFSEVVLVGLDSIGKEYSGKYVATDTGGAIKDKRIDVYIGNYPEVNRFGRRDMKVVVLKD
ncbi:MAG: 3D domain-containing protein [Clostridia bacterium]